MYYKNIKNVQFVVCDTDVSDDSEIYDILCALKKEEEIFSLSLKSQNIYSDKISDYPKAIVLDVQEHSADFYVYRKNGRLKLTDISFDNIDRINATSVILSKRKYTDDLRWSLMEFDG